MKYKIFFPKFIMILLKKSAIKVKPAFFLMIAFFAIFFIPKISLATSNIVINEIFTNPTGDDTGLEWIELYNPTAQNVDLTGWQLGADKYFTIPSFNLADGSFVLIHWRIDGNNNSNNIFTGSQATLDNLGNKSGYVALFTAGKRGKETIADYIEYGEAGKTWESTAQTAGIWQAGQFVDAPGEGQSLGLKQDGQDQNLTSDWQIFSVPTPDQSNTNTPINTSEQTTSQQQKDITQQNATFSSTPIFYDSYSDKILINEFMPWPGPSADGGKEWVELINQGDQIIDLSGWQIDDSPDASPPYLISSSTLILPNQYLVIELDKNILNNEGDEVRLIWPDGQLVHSVSYKNSKQNLSSSRFENGLWLWTDQPTPGQENKKSAQKSSPPPQIENLSLQNALPAIAAISEAVSQEKNENDGNEENIVAAADTNPDLKQVSSQNQITASQSSAAQQITAKNSNFSPLLALIAIAALSCLSGIGIVYFKRRKAVDSN